MINLKETISFAVMAVPALVVITNPLLATSAFLTLTTHYPSSAKKSVIRKAVSVAFAVLFIFAISGTFIFRMFSITIGSFQIAGGVILFTVALGMLHAKAQRMKQTPQEMKEAMTRDDIAVVPLAIPMISGPGAITTVLVLAGDATDVSKMIVLFVSLIIAMMVVFLVLRRASRLQRFVGASGMNIMNRLMGLILAAVAVQFIINGIKAVIPEIKAVL